MTAVFAQQITHLFAEAQIIKLKAAHVLGVLVFNNQKASILLMLRGLYFYKRADFSLSGFYSRLHLSTSKREASWDVRDTSCVDGPANPCTKAYHFAVIKDRASTSIPPQLHRLIPWRSISCRC
jgi:hypothetical protein